MKTETSQSKRPLARRTKRAQPNPKSAPRLPEWVIGVYDGPKDKRLSSKEGYSR